MRIQKKPATWILLAIIISLIIYSYKFFTLIGVRFPFRIPSYFWSKPIGPLVYMSFFLFFLVSLLFHKHVGIKANSVFLAFIISLLYEMFGFSLSLYFLSVLLGRPNWIEYHLVKGHPKTFLPHIVRFPFFAITWLLGLFLIFKGWNTIYKHRNELCTSGVYSYIRHPQYLGLCCILTGYLFHFPTPLLAILYAILLFMYYKSARKEEQILEAKYGESFLEYKRNVGMYFPRLRIFLNR